MLQYNKEFTNAFRKVNRRFYNRWTDIFDYKKYHLFFRYAETQEIQKYFDDSQQFVINLIHHIKNVEQGKNSWSRYFIDVTTLLCSGMDTDLRNYSIDNTRAHVDVGSADLDKLFEDIQFLKEQAQKENPSLICLVIPTDFTLLYNVADYVVVGIDMSNRKLIQPHIFEAKRKMVHESLYSHGVEKQQLRESRQIDRMRLQRIQYDTAAQHPRLNNFYKYTTFFVGKNKLTVFLKQPEQTFKIDDTFSLHVTKEKKIHISKDEWCVDLLDEIFCGTVIPSIFRCIPLKHVDKLMAQNIHIFFRVNKKSFRENFMEIKGVKSVDKHPSPYHSYIHLEKIRLSVANMIHAKYPLKALVACFKESIIDLKFNFEA